MSLKLGKQKLLIKQQHAKIYIFKGMVSEYLYFSSQACTILSLHVRGLLAYFY